VYKTVYREQKYAQIHHDYCDPNQKINAGGINTKVKWIMRLKKCCDRINLFYSKAVGNMAGTNIDRAEQTSKIGNIATKWSETKIF
jgi:hypothetical protein